jgi:hypothetical protein
VGAARALLRASEPAAPPAAAISAACHPGRRRAARARETTVARAGAAPLAVGCIGDDRPSGAECARAFGLACAVMRGMDVATDMSSCQQSASRCLQIPRRDHSSVDVCFERATCSCHRPRDVCGSDLRSIPAQAPHKRALRRSGPHEHGQLPSASGIQRPHKYQLACHYWRSRTFQMMAIALRAQRRVVRAKQSGLLLLNTIPSPCSS